MGKKPIPMDQIRRLLQLANGGNSIRKIAKITKFSRNTVRLYLHKCDANQASYGELLKMEDSELGQLFYASGGGIEKPNGNRMKQLEELLPGFVKELSKVGVTKELLWQEYKLAHPTGYGYTRFCHFLGQHVKTKKTSMTMSYFQGEKMMIDFAGKNAHYVDEDGVVVECPVLVMVLPYSGYTYCEPLESMRGEDLVVGIENGLIYFNGVTKAMIFDNLAQVIKKSNRYEPEINDLLIQFSLHYNTTIMAARVAKPQDKGSVERTVELVYERIYAPLRNISFRSLRELKAGFIGQLDPHHDRPFRDKKQTRRDLYKEESLHLNTLPSTRLEIKRRVNAKVQKNYHVVLGEDWHYYSVPYNIVGQMVEIVYTNTMVEIYHNKDRIAVHIRSRKSYGHTTLEQHMPSQHQHYKKMKGWNAEYFKLKALDISQEVVQVIDKVLGSKLYYEQTFNSCIGIFRLGVEHGNERLTKACAMALQAKSANYRFIHNILKNKTDLRYETNSTTQQYIIPNDSANIRGSNQYSLFDQVGNNAKTDK